MVCCCSLWSVQFPRKHGRSKTAIIPKPLKLKTFHFPPLSSTYSSIEASWLSLLFSCMSTSKWVTNLNFLELIALTFHLSTSSSQNTYPISHWVVEIKGQFSLIHTPLDLYISLLQQPTLRILLPHGGAINSTESRRHLNRQQHGYRVYDYHYLHSGYKKRCTSTANHLHLRNIKGSISHILKDNTSLSLPTSCQQIIARQLTPTLTTHTHIHFSHQNQ